MFKSARFWSLFLTAGILLSGCNEQQAGKASAPKVQVIKPRVDTVTIKKDFVGQVYGTSDVPIRARVDGFLVDELFQEGRRVKKGQVLYHIDPLQSEQEVSASQSNYEEARAGLVQAQNDLERIRPLAEINAVSKSDLDAAIANKEAAEKRVEAARANLNLSKINLSYTQITSPIDGVIGKSNVEIGEYVGSSFNSAILNTVSQIDTIKVEFFLTEEDYLLFAREALREKNESEVTGQRPRRNTETLELILSDGSLFDQRGRTTFLDRGVDPTTGTILVEAAFANPDKLLRPGQFAKIRAVVESIPNAVLVPYRALIQTQGIYSVKVVDESGTVSVRSVKIKTIPSIKDMVVVTEGLTADEQLILNGLQIALDGMTVDAELVDFTSQADVQ
jgi:membrane fusion protein (multidrug efflux system)